MTATEANDEDSAYEVEVELDDGRSVDVQLDASFKLVSIDGDVESDVESDGGSEDED